MALLALALPIQRLLIISNRFEDATVAGTGPGAGVVSFGGDVLLLLLSAVLLVVAEGRRRDKTSLCRLKRLFNLLSILSNLMACTTSIAVDWNRFASTLQRLVVKVDQNTHESESVVPVTCTSCKPCAGLGTCLISDQSCLLTLPTGTKSTINKLNLLPSSIYRMPKQLLLAELVLIVYRAARIASLVHCTYCSCTAKSQTQNTASFGCRAKSDQPYPNRCPLHFHLQLCRLYIVRSL